MEKCLFNYEVWTLSLKLIRMNLKMFDIQDQPFKILKVDGVQRNEAEPKIPHSPFVILLPLGALH